jgi:hypothetical protein
MPDLQKLFASKYVKVDYKSFYYSNPSSVNGPFGQFSLGSVPGNQTTFGPFSLQLLFGLPVKVELQTMGECQKTDSGFSYTLKGTGTRQQIGHHSEPYEMYVVVKLDSSLQSGTVQFGDSLLDLYAPLPVHRIASSTGQ